MLVRIAIAYFIIEKKKAAPQPWQAIAQRFCSIESCLFHQATMKIAFIYLFIIAINFFIALKPCKISYNIAFIFIS